jgi:hypothetical protein
MVSPCAQQPHFDSADLQRQAEVFLFVSEQTQEARVALPVVKSAVAQVIGVRIRIPLLTACKPHDSLPIPSLTQQFGNDDNEQDD